MQLQNRVALITGANSGIGAAAAGRLAQAGARIGALGRNKDKVEAFVDSLRSEGADVIPLVADVSDGEQIHSVIERLYDRWGRIDIVFANAGINGVWAPIEELEIDEWDKTLSVNLRGTFLTIKYAVPYLKKQGGSVIITSSVNGTRMFSNTGATAYACSKAGQVAMAKMLALELASERIRVNVICPGAISTQISENTEKRHVEEAREPVEFPEGQVPLTHGKPGRPEQVAELVYFLASDASDHISGTEMWIDGAQSLFQG